MANPVPMPWPFWRDLPPTQTYYCYQNPLPTRVIYHITPTPKLPPGNLTPNDVPVPGQNRVPYVP